MCKNFLYVLQFSSVQLFSHGRLFETPWTATHQSSLSITNSGNSNSCPSSWCAIQPSHPLLSPSPPSISSASIFPSIIVFSNGQCFASGSQSIGVSASASVLPMNIQDWFSLGLTGLISLQFKGLSRVFSNTGVQKHQFFGTQLSLWSNSHIHTWLLEKL